MIESCGIELEIPVLQESSRRRKVRRWIHHGAAVIRVTLGETSSVGQTDRTARLIERSESRSLAGLVRRSLDGIDPVVMDAVLLAVTRAHERLSPQSLARLLAQPRRAVTLRLSAEGFPPPQRLLTWGRLIVAAHMLEDRHRSADRVANTLDFPSGSAFRNTCQRYLHATPGQVRARGGAAYVVRALLRQVHSRVSSAHEPRSRSPTRTPSLAI